MHSMMTKLTAPLTRLRENHSGTFAVWGAMLLPVLMGGAAFGVDASKLYNMDHDLQAGADALARAGASELDRAPDSLTRATRAVQLMVRNEHKFGVRAGQVKVERIRFLKGLPERADMAIGADYDTNDPAEARFIHVELKPESVGTFFPADFTANALGIDMSAQASAGRSQRVCGVAPIFLCNPFEDETMTLEAALQSKDFQRRQVQFKRPTGQTRSRRGGRRGNGNSCGGDQSTWGPGSFGYLEMPGYKGASAMRKAVGIDKPDICMEQGGTVRLRTGNINSMHFGFNVRFDMYGGPMKKYRTDPRYAPAENVVRGVSGRACNERYDRNAMGFPRDDCHERGNCRDGHGQLGTGNWDFIEYMRVNHANMSPITIDGVKYTIDYRRNRMSPSTPPSRYAMYRWEIDNNCIPGRETYGRHASTPEEGIPQCHSEGASTADVDRRVIYAAVLNCEAIEANGGMRAGRDLPIETFVKVFLTEPVGSGSEPTIYGEIVGPVTDGIDAVASERAELAR